MTTLVEHIATNVESTLVDLGVRASLHMWDQVPKIAIRNNRNLHAATIWFMAEGTMLDVRGVLNGHHQFKYHYADPAFPDNLINYITSSPHINY